MTEFWNEEITNKSFEKLMLLKNELDFVLIGGWAIYLYTKAYKSKDIDIIVDYDNLNLLKMNYNLSKNDFLKKYEIKQEYFDIDIYVPKFSELTYSLTKILKEFVIVDGFKLPTPETLVLLKTQAYIARKGTIKGKKDSLDIALILIKTNFDFKKYFGLLKEIKHLEHTNSLTEIIKSIDEKDLSYLKIARTDFIKKKKEMLIALKN